MSGLHASDCTGWHERWHQLDAYIAYSLIAKIHLAVLTLMAFQQKQKQTGAYVVDHGLTDQPQGCAGADLW